MTKKRSQGNSEQILPFEKPLFELREIIEATESPEERAKVEQQLRDREKAVFGGITAWERVQLARHPLRPRMLDYTSRILDDFIELHGDRNSGDDPAMICGIGRFNGQTIFVIGQQKGVSTDEKVRCNFGMAHPEGYRKSLRIMKLAERLGYPVVSFVDTPAAHPGIEAEQRGQGPAIANNLLECSRLNTPMLSVILSEGGSGGALAIAMGDEVLMFEHAVYMICPPERCAEILWRDAEKKELAASALRVSAADLKELGVIDRILPEPEGGAHRNPEGAAAVLSDAIGLFLERAAQGAYTLAARQQKFEAMGVWDEVPMESLMAQLLVPDEDPALPLGPAAPEESTGLETEAMARGSE